MTERHIGINIQQSILLIIHLIFYFQNAHGKIHTIDLDTFDFLWSNISKIWN